MLMSELFNRYEREIVPRMAPRTQKDYKWILAQLHKHVGDRHAEDIKPKDIGKLLDVETGKISRNRQVAVLSAVFTKAVGRWYVVERNPCLGVERNETRRRDRYIADDEFKAFYSVVPPRIQIAMDLALLTGQRQGDIIGLPWSNVLEDGIFFQQGKTGKKLLVGYSEKLKDILLRARRLGVDWTKDFKRHYVLRRRDGERYTSEGFRAIWQRYMNRAMRIGAVKERFTFHDIRAKSVSDTSNIQEAFERAGHTSMAMTRGVYDRGTRKVTPLR